MTTRHGEPPDPPAWDGRPLSDEAIARYTAAPELPITLREALAPFLRQAESEASRPQLEDGQFTGPGPLTVGDWRRLHLAAATLR